MKKYIIYGILSMPLLLTACNDSENTPTNPDEKRAEVKLLCSYEDTRATDTTFEPNDRLGVYMVKGGEDLQLGGNELNNEFFSYDGNVWKSRRQVYWNEGSHDIYAYYPFIQQISDVYDMTFKVETDQSSHSGYTASDLLWSSKRGVEASDSPVSLVFSHCMSKTIVKLEKSEDYEGEIPDDCEVYLHSTVTTASMDLTTGGVSKDSSAPIESIKAEKLDKSTFQAIVVPQNIESRRPLVEVVTSGVSYLMEAKISFRQGMAHSLIVTLSKNPTQTKIEIGGSIGGWN